MNYRPARQGIAGISGRFFIVGMLVALLVLGPLVGAGVAFADTSYNVQPGDTLTSIAARYGVSVDELVSANGLPNRSVIYVGQSLTIPTPGSKPPTGNSGSSSSPSGTYVVQPGDNLSTIAVRFGTTVAAIMQANGLTSSTIYSGQVLNIGTSGNSVPATPKPQPQPTSPPQQANPGTYVVQPGDSFSRIAAKFGITAQALAAANGLTLASFIYAGQVLTVPDQGQQPAPTDVPPTTPPTPAAVTPVPTEVPATSVPTAGTTTTPIAVESPGSAELGKPVKYTVKPGDSLSSIASTFSTTVAALMQLNGLTDPNFVYVGQVLTIVKGDDQNNNPGTPATPVSTPTPPMGKFGPKWVDVNLTTQTMVAYEGQTPVYSSRVSSGTSLHPTVIGTYRVYAKYVTTRMQGGTKGVDYYNIPNVPYTLYFYSGYALHGAFWHNNFGEPMSHGCVNLPVDVAKWVYEWAPVGTMVVTHK
ncbi:MAG: LysM peptidoglycan-binding domain-containing protein [Chloroflexota bacterium]